MDEKATRGTAQAAAAAQRKLRRPASRRSFDLFDQRLIGSSMRSITTSFGRIETPISPTFRWDRERCLAPVILGERVRPFTRQSCTSFRAQLENHKREPSGC